VLACCSQLHPLASCWKANVFVTNSLLMGNTLYQLNVISFGCFMFSSVHICDVVFDASVPNLVSRNFSMFHMLLSVCFMHFQQSLVWTVSLHHYVFFVPAAILHCVWIHQVLRVSLYLFFSFTQPNVCYVACSTGHSCLIKTCGIVYPVGISDWCMFLF
jgi:hypothetical protein